jgi:aminoglycoside 3-N-acetyltransferase
MGRRPPQCLGTAAIMSKPLRSHGDMTEAVSPPVTRERLVRDLRELGIEPGQTLLVNASLRSIGWVEGGAPAVVAALRELVGPAGNLVVPVGTEENSNFSRAQRDVIAGMTWDELRAYRKLMPAFDKHTTPSGMGAIAEALRTTVGAVRSDHPQSSFAAIGPKASLLMADHQLESHLGEQSPLAKLYDRHAQVLMIGVGYGYCTAMHLAEYRYTDSPPRQTYTCVVTTDGKRGWIGYHDVVLADNDFEEIGKSLAEEIAVREGYAGQAECRLMPVRDTVDFAVKWMAKYRKVDDPELMRVGDLCKL